MEITKSLGRANESTILLIPSTMCQYLDIKPGDKIVLKDDEGKHGKFLSLWKKEVQEDGN